MANLDMTIKDYFAEKNSLVIKLFINARYYVKLVYDKNNNIIICNLYNHKQDLIKKLNDNMIITLQTSVLEVYEYALGVMRDYINSKPKYQAQNDFDKINVKHYGLKLNKNTDSDIVEWLAQKDNLQGYFKKLIRKDIIRNR